MNPYIEQHKEEYTQAIDQLKKEVGNIRTGRATPALVENLIVDAYGAKTPLLQLATINAIDARTLTVEPWDKSILKDIEKALQQSELGISPVNEGQLIRIVIPALTEERRMEFVKVLKGKIEDAKVRIRQIRDKVKEAIQNAEKEKAITEDDKFMYLKDLDKYTSEQYDIAEQAAAGKKKELEEV